MEGGFPIFRPPGPDSYRNVPFLVWRRYNGKAGLGLEADP